MKAVDEEDAKLFDGLADASPLDDKAVTDGMIQSMVVEGMIPVCFSVLFCTDNDDTILMTMIVSLCSLTGCDA